MHTDQWEEDMMAFGDSELEMELLDEGWDLVEDEALIEETDESDDALIAPTAEEIQALISQIGTIDSSESNENSTLPRERPGSGASEEPFPGLASDLPASGRVIATADTVTIGDLDDELREAFMDDASSCVGSMEQSLLRLESEPSDSGALNQICRELHTLKGASASVGLSALADQLHQLEDALTDEHQSGRSPDINSLLNSIDSIRSQIAGSSAPASEPTSNESALGEPTSINPAPVVPTADPAADKSQSIKQVVTAPTFVDDSDDDESVRVKSSQLNRLMDMLAQLVMLRNRRGNELSELQEIYHELIGSVSKMRLLSNETDPDSAVCSSIQLSEVANDVLEVAQQVRECSRPISEGNAAVSQFIREFREELVELRRTPIGGLFRRLQRVVRDAANAEGKEVRLELIGADAGIERALQQRLYEPLLHIVRNSVCHGIESPDDRQQNGKECCGTISLEARSGPDLFVIEIRDDGRGLDYDAIRRRGIESGLLTADHPATDQELSQLIFKPGFSTRQTADQIAGRGVGMDVVATTLQRMRGWLEVDSEANQGTRIRLSFPLPSVIQHALVFRAANQLFALPMQSIQATGGSESIGVEVALVDLLGQRTSNTTEPSQRITVAGDVPKANSSDDHSGRVTLLVDEIVGPEELVVRPLPNLLKRHPYCSGATLSGMGSTVLFLDGRRMMASYRQSGSSCTSEPTPKSADRVDPASTARPRVLVVDDSISARKRVVRSLRRYGVEIVEANDGRQALEIFKQESFAAIFSDMEMPHVSGMELLADVNSQESPSPPPVVIISSRHEVEFTGRAQELGANNYLIKPLTDEALDRAIIDIPTLRHLIPNQPIGSPNPLNTPI